MSVLKQINKEIEDFKTKQVQIVPGLSFNQYDTLNQIAFYYNSKYMSGDLDDDGEKKFFYNINRNPCKVFSKSIDFDTKNIRLLTVGGGDPLKTWFMERDLKFWMRDKQFGKVLNRIFKELPIYGSVVLKIVDGFPYFVDLRNFVLEQSADSLEDSSYIIEVHNYTVSGFRKIGKQMGWDKEKIEEVVKKFHQMRGASHIKVYERYGEVEEDDEYKYKRVFIADVGVDEFDQFRGVSVPRPGIELGSEEWEGNPYWEFHADKVAGRWLGIGVVEELFEPQIAENLHTNLQGKSSYWAALRVFQTRDGAVNRNMLSDVKNGEILNVDSEITPINMEDRNLAFFNQQDQKWMKNRDELTFSYDVVQGERLPAGTPLGSANIAVSQTLTYFEQIQENVAMDIKEMLYEIIIPRFQKENSSEHTIRLAGQDLDAYIEMIKNNLALKEIIRQISLGKPIPTEEQRDMMIAAIAESIKQEKEKILTIPKNFYDKIKYDVDIDITGESVDTRIRYATRFAILQAITSDPTMTSDPVKRKILAGMAEDGGLNPGDLFDVQVKEVEKTVLPVGRAGGGVSAPAIGKAVPGEAQQTI